MPRDLKSRAQGCAALGCGTGCLGIVLWVLYLIGASIAGALSSNAVVRQFEREGFRLTNYSSDYGSMSLAPLAPADFDNAALERLIALFQQKHGRSLYLNLDDCPRLTNVDPLAALPPEGLSSLSMNNCKNLVNLDGLKGQQYLRSLKLNGCEKLKDVDALANTNLGSVELKDCAALVNIQGLANLPHLSELRLTRCISLSKIDGLSDLLRLDLSGCRRLKSIDTLKRCRQLEELNLSHCVELTNVSALAGLSSLRRVNLSGCPKVSDLSPLASLKSLRWLSVADSPQLTELKWISKFPVDEWQRGLASLDVQRCPRLIDVAPLLPRRGLSELDLTGCPVPPRDVAILRRAFPEAHIQFREGP